MHAIVPESRCDKCRTHTITVFVYYFIIHLLLPIQSLIAHLHASSYYLWPAVGCPPENLAYEQLFDNERGGFILAGLQPEPTVTVGHAFGWQGQG